MDYLRSCYSTQAVFTADGTSLVDTIDWRFVSATSPVVFPNRHVFSSLGWTRNRFGWPAATLGEVPGAPRPYSKGADLHPLPGSHHCGPDSWYVDGVPTPLSEVRLDKNGELACCSGLFGWPGDAEPPRGGAPPGHLVNYNGHVIPATLDAAGHWAYISHSGDPNYTWLNFVTAHGVRRSCPVRLIRAVPFGGLLFRDLQPVAWDPTTGVSSWEDPTGVVVPTGQVVTVFPGP